MFKLPHIPFSYYTFLQLQKQRLPPKEPLQHQRKCIPIMETLSSFHHVMECIQMSAFYH